MPIDPLSSSSPLIAALRAEISRKSGKISRQDSTEAPPGSAGTARKPRDVNALRRELAEILKDVSPNDEDALNAVRPRVVRAVLLWEFGAELREHREWQPILDRLVDTLQRNERHRDDFARLVRELQA